MNPVLELAKRYGGSLYDLAAEEKLTEELLQELQTAVDSIEAELREPGLSAERRELLAVSLATLRAREAAALERLHAESALAQLKMADWNASR